VIVDTSALVAILKSEAGHGALLDAIGREGGSLPAPAMLEYDRVTRVTPNAGKALELLDLCAQRGLAIVAFTADHARIAADGNGRYGKGNGTGGRLNILDLMVYAVARERGEPLLCTGRDFATTDLVLHAASRLD
jgi:ribonuclease VapC